MYIDDCIKGVQLILNSDILEPVNLGSSEMVSINQLVDVVEDIAKVKLKRIYDLDAPNGIMKVSASGVRIGVTSCPALTSSRASSAAL